MKKLIALLLAVTFICAGTIGSIGCGDTKSTSTGGAKTTGGGAGTGGDTKK